MIAFTDDDFPVTASGRNVYRKMQSGPICTCADMEMAAEIAKRLNRDNQVYPDDGKSVERTTDES